MSNPYQVNRYAAEPTGTLCARDAVASAAGMVGCVLTMAALCLGMMYLMWRFSGR